MAPSPKPYAIPPPEISPTSFKSTTRIMPQADMGDNVAADDYSFFHSRKFGIAFLAMCLNVMLFGLDQFILSVAVPQIVSQFNSLHQIEWLNTAVHLGVQSVASPRWTYLTSLLVFNIGCAVCGTANSMNVLIAGRAIAGLGGAGLWNATYLIGGEVIPFEKRPGLFGLFGVSFIIASVMGPLVGGAFVSVHGWRWCFYFSLPIGGINWLLLLWTLPSVPRLPPFDGRQDNRPGLVKLFRLDWLSAALTLGFVTCLGMALQWGGVTKEWNDPAVITLTMAFGLFAFLITWSYVMGSRAMIPLSLFGGRHLWWVLQLGIWLMIYFSAGAWVAFLGYGVVVIYLYYLPLLLEAVKNKSATRAGVLLLALQCTMGPLLVLSGKVGERTGQAKYTVVIGSCLMAIASGLMTMLKSAISIATVIGFQIVAGVGQGNGPELVVLVQADYLKRPHLLPHVTNLFNFWGFVGRIISMSIATSVFNNKLRNGLEVLVILRSHVREEVAAAPKTIWTVVPEGVRGAVLDIYASSLVRAFWLAFAFSIACIAAACCMRDINLKEAADEVKAIPEASSINGSYPMASKGEHQIDFSQPPPRPESLASDQKDPFDLGLQQPGSQVGDAVGYHGWKP
ncbi:hypothetical protein I316_06957 [Kwoniella heveanensis BCC8398]|uniref:Major facilitator superfamily (MFS) profile domain-containing protein n=1 Tax=Kwoniella heveanensis BCC8398 TaxID=1296120 RepID=A0A1B9GJT3_9TREE|nr:hypothetical protein I316_06957 [Kwoniella heveanensis BCC8398]